MILELHRQGVSVSAIAREVGLEPHVIAETATIDGLVHALCRYVEQTRAAAGARHTGGDR